MKEIINNKDKTYSPLALYFLIDNDIQLTNEEVNNYFDIIINEISQSDIRLPVTKIIKNNYKKLIKLGFEKEDTSNLIRLLL